MRDLRTREWSDETLDALAGVSEEEVLDAADLWRESVPGDLSSLLEATEA